MKENIITEMGIKDRINGTINHLPKGISFMTTKVYNKLVRDRIPEIIEKSGKLAVTEILDDTAYKNLLDAKLSEELQEYLESDSTAELADLQEVILAILDYKGVTYEDFEALRRQKAEERGGFREQILLKEVREIE